MLALLSSPVRRWLLATLLLPVVAFALAKVGLYLQRRNGGAPTRLSRALLSVSAFTRRRSSRGNDRNDLIDNPRPDTPPITPPPATTTPNAPQQ
ncbi:hypothetical protein EUA04_20830 [Mycolicibacterium obuense]|uniref:Uncharacterized protein n=2 Tax=Mycolicibacterium TaxID=1866885 RepID=A0A4R5X4N4_9MYCO|nr:hypothetical protein [Mycolicibacterium]KMO82424.1 hypothetical protein MCHLDSM_01047 [Mycolicibacterium chlorophenolicum]TDL05004.1 hypothetical protein EUA04_20830 [Mycolicibacterium obuense]